MIVSQGNFFRIGQQILFRSNNRFYKTSKMKRYLITILLSGMLLGSGTITAQVSYGPSVAVQYSSVIGGYSYIKYLWDYGYNVGCFVSIPTHENQLIRSGLFINSLGYKYQYTEPYLTGSATSTLSLRNAYLQLPIVFMQKFKSGLHVEGGVFGEYQISQHQREVGSYSYTSDSLVLYGGIESNDYSITARRFQAGITTSFGYLYSGFDLSLSSQGNLTTLFRKEDVNYKGEHLFALGLSLAYHIR
jgi:hypothetical protein